MTTVVDELQKLLSGPVNLTTDAAVAIALAIELLKAKQVAHNLVTVPGLFSEWFDSVHGEPSYQETFEAGYNFALPQGVFADKQPAQALDLSDEEIQAIWVETGLDECDPETFARAIIAALNAKATT